MPPDTIDPKSQKGRVVNHLERLDVAARRLIVQTNSVGYAFPPPVADDRHAKPRPFHGMVRTDRHCRAVLVEFSPLQGSRRSRVARWKFDHFRLTGLRKGRFGPHLQIDER